MYTVYNCKNYFSSDMLQMSLRGRECFVEKNQKQKKICCSSLEIICILNLDVKINVPPPSLKTSKMIHFPNVLNYISKESLTFKTISRKNVIKIQIGSIWGKKSKYSVIYLVKTILWIIGKNSVFNFLHLHETLFC